MATRSNLEKLRFAIVGGLNTAIDFAILLILNGLGINSILANYISTTSALLFSFFANKKFTFRVEGKVSAKQLTSFFVLTAVGLWILQPLIIYSIQQVANNSNIRGWYVLPFAKILATVVSLTWNYIMYSRFVFDAAKAKG